MRPTAKKLHIRTGGHWCDCGYISVDSKQHQGHFEKGYHKIFADRKTNGPCECPSYQEWSDVKRLSVRNLDDEVQYYTTAIKAGGRYFYCKDNVTVEITDYEYHRVTHNPRLCYFTTALWLHYYFEGVRRKASERVREDGH
jgi:hypothetical protein